MLRKYAVVGASCSLYIQSGQDAPKSLQRGEPPQRASLRTTNLNIWDALKIFERSHQICNLTHQ